MLIPCSNCKGEGTTTSRFCDYDEEWLCDSYHATGKVEHDLNKDVNLIYYISNDLKEYRLYSDDWSKKEGFLKYLLLRLSDLYSNLQNKFEDVNLEYNNLKDDTLKEQYIAKYNKVEPFINKVETNPMIEFIGWED